MQISPASQCKQPPVHGWMITNELLTIKKSYWLSGLHVCPCTNLFWHLATEISQDTVVPLSMRGGGLYLIPVWLQNNGTEPRTWTNETTWFANSRICTNKTTAMDLLHCLECHVEMMLLVCSSVVRGFT